jgi:outer membrane protein
MGMGMQVCRKLALGAVCGALVLGGGGAVAAEGDWIVRVGVAHVSPNDDSGELSGVAGAEVSVDSATSLGITIAWMATDNVGIGVLGAWPFKHDIKGEGALSGAGKIAEVKHLPPTVTLQYHFNPAGAARPFVGAGINYTTFFSEKTHGLGGASISLDDSWGWAVEAGIDFDLNQDWFASAQLWYIAIDTTATLGDGLGTIDVDIDPWVAMIGAGRRF